MSLTPKRLGHFKLVQYNECLVSIVDTDGPVL